MKRPFLILAAVFGISAGLFAQSIEIAADQNPALEKTEVGGQILPALAFSGKRFEVFPLPLEGDQGAWGGKSALVLKLHNASASQGHLVVFLRDTLDDKSPKAFPRLYHWTKIPVDWVGWREVDIPLTDFKPSTGQIENGARELPAEISQIWFGNQIGPEDPAANTWGVPKAEPFTLGIERVTVRE